MGFSGGNLLKEKSIDKFYHFYNYLFDVKQSKKIGKNCQNVNIFFMKSQEGSQYQINQTNLKDTPVVCYIDKGIFGSMN